eukprot:gene6675-7759_t
MVGALGFGSGGILAGSFAASMMSSLGSGAVVVGTLQSIGATGAIAASTVAAAGATGAHLKRYPLMLLRMAKSYLVL